MASGFKINYPEIPTIQNQPELINNAIMKSIKYLLLPTLLLFTACLQSNDPYNDTEDLAFLEEYADREGVITTESGLMYRTIEEGNGSAPSSTSTLILNLKGGSIDGSRIADTFENEYPSILFLESEPLGYREGFQLMRTGGEYELVIPSNLAFNDGRVLYFERIELIDTDQTFISNYSQREDVITTGSGLRYRVIEEGAGDNPVESSSVTVNYTGSYINGAEFESNDSAPFFISTIIDGLAEGIQLMNEGATYEFMILPELAYGNQQPSLGLPLIFEIELLEIN